MIDLDLKESIQTNIMSRLIDVIHLTDDIIEIFGEASKCLSQAAKCDFVNILLNNEKERYFSVHHALNQIISERRYDVIIPYNETSITEIIRSHHSIIREDLSERGKLTPGDLKFLVEGIKSDLSVPIIIKNRIHAIINLSSYEAGYFTDNHRIQAEQVASLLGLALERSDFNEKLNKRHSDLILWKNKFNVLINNLDEAMAIVCLDYDLIYETNNAFQKLTGYSYEELQGMRLSQLHPQQEERILSRLDNCSASGKFGEIEQILLKRKANEQISVRLRFAHFGDNNTTHLGFALYDKIAESGSVISKANNTGESAEEFVHLQLSTIYEIYKLANSDVALEQLIQSILLAIKKAADFDYAQITLFDDDKEHVQYYTIVSDRCREYDEQKSWIIVEKCDWYWYHFSQENLRQQLKQYENCYENMERELRSRISAVLMTKKWYLGTIVFGSLQANYYQKHHINFIKQMVEQIAILIENTKLHHESIFYSERIESDKNEFENFIETLSQNLKMSLAVMQGLSSTLLNSLKEEMSDENFDTLKRIKIKADNMQRYIDASLKISKVGQVIRPLEQVNSSDIVEQAKTKLLSNFNQKKITIVVDNELPIIYSDPNLMQQVFINLIENVIRNLDENNHKHKIEIGCSSGSEDEMFYIRCTNKGIRREFHENIFDLFQYIEYEGEKEIDTVLNFAVAKKIIEMHKGQIWFECEEGKGCTYYFNFPKKKLELL